MRISDWSSDVCSSDLATLRSHLPRHGPVLTNDIFILVVEDETLIEEIVVSGLEDAGYTVVAAHTAEEAIAQLEKGDPVIRAIVTDVNFAPEKLTGWDVARRARERTADIPIIHMSGASGHEWTSHCVPHRVLID